MKADCMTEDEKRIWNKALIRAYNMIYEKYPVNDMGDQNKTASKIQSEIMKLMQVTKEGERIFNDRCVK